MVRYGQMLLLSMMAGWRDAVATQLPYSQGGAYEVDAGAHAGVIAWYVDGDGGSDTNDVRTLTVCERAGGRPGKELHVVLRTEGGCRTRPVSLSFSDSGGGFPFLGGAGASSQGRWPLPHLTGGTNTFARGFAFVYSRCKLLTGPWGVGQNAPGVRCLIRPRLPGPLRSQGGKLKTERDPPHPPNRELA